MKPSYFVTTWCPRRQEFTPQHGVRTGPYSLFGLRKALLALREMGYDANRTDNSIHVERRPLEPFSPELIEALKSGWMETSLQPKKQLE